MRTLLDTRDVDHARAQVARSYCPFEIKVAGDGAGFRARHSEAGSPDVNVFRFGYGSEAVDIHPVPFRDFVLISRPIAGQLRVRSRRVDLGVPAGQAVALDATYAHHLRFEPGCRILTVQPGRYWSPTAEVLLLVEPSPPAASPTTPGTVILAMGPRRPLRRGPRRAGAARTRRLGLCHL
jgi:hypothetical protein